MRLLQITQGTQSRPDCLAEMLLDFLALEHAALQPDDLRAWLRTVAACLAVFLEQDSRHVPRTTRADHWLHAVSNRLAMAFPHYPGGRRSLRRMIESMVVEHWRF